jgi:K+-sensing histidine kinase KdpD
MLDTTPRWVWHALLMTAGFICIMAAGLLPVYGKRIAGWYRIHVASAVIGGILVILAVSMVFAVPYLSAIPSAFLVHVVLGVLLVLSLLTALLLALLRSRVGGSRKATMRTAHLWMGRVFIVLVVINILLGLTAVGLLLPCLL